MPSEKPIIQKETVVGINTDVKSVHLIDDDQVLYCCGNHVLIWNRHTKKQSFLYQCGNSEEIQSIVLFCSRNLVAICVEKMEKGLYIIIFNLCTLKRKKLLKFQNEDEKRIVDISFTLDGKHCLVLHGAPNFLLALWNIEKMPKSVATVRLATPSGKQLTKASIRPVLGDNKEMIVCASGLGIIRFFKMFDGIFRPITVNLRRELQNYIVHCWLSNDTCVLGTDTNEIIVMQNFVTKAVVTIDGWNQNITTMLGFSHGLVIGGTRGSIRLYACVEDKGFIPEFSKEFMLDDKDVPNVIAIDIAATEEMCLCLLNNGKICSVPLTDDTITIDHKIVPCLHNVGKNGIPHITCMAACLLKPIIALGGSDRSLNIWNFDINDFELKVTLESNIVGISLHPNSLQILICLENHVELSYIHREAFSPVWRKDLQTNGSSSFSNGGQCFALVCGQFVQVYDTHTFNPISTLRGHTGPIQSLSWNQDGQEIATIGTDSIICVWNVLNGKRRVRHGKYKFSSKRFLKPSA
jgi:WD40 repeat protein